MNSKLTYHDCQAIRRRHARQRIVLSLIALIVLLVVVLAISGCSPIDAGVGMPTPAPAPKTTATPHDSGWIVLPGATTDPHICAHSSVCLP